jgi:hypothetical protein
VAKGPQAFSCFQREVKTASSLNHLNICTVHEIDEQIGQAFIAMAFLADVTPSAT